MQLGRIDPKTPRQTALSAQRRDADVTAAGGNSRALVALTPAAAPSEPLAHRQAAFLAHLIATKDQLPQTRERRRVEPGDAIAAYRATAALTDQ